MLGNASGIDLNNASVHQLSHIGGLGLVLAARIVDNTTIPEMA
jgi:DNA uptake protein ComE-like DNA-binding protein